MGPKAMRYLIEEALREVKAGRPNYAAASCSMFLWPKNAKSRQGRCYRCVLEAYEDIISKRIPEAIANLEEALYPDGIPAYVRAVERVAA